MHSIDSNNECVLCKIVKLSVKKFADHVSFDILQKYKDLVYSFKELKSSILSSIVKGRGSGASVVFFSLKVLILSNG
jgi:hypothetical protein